MKKLTLLILPALFLALPYATHAQALGQPCLDFSCDSGLVCKTDSSGTATCQNNTATQSAGTCTVDAGCVNYGTGWTCQGGTCVAPANTTTNTNVTGFVPLAPIPGLTDSQSNLGASSLAQFLQNLYKYLIGIAAILAVIEIIVGGLEYATQDNVSKKSDGRHRIEQAILGLVLVLSPALVFSLINPSILNLSLNLPPLNTASGTGSSNTSGNGTVQNGTGGVTTGNTQGTSAGCNTPTGGNAYQSVSCATNDAAITWNKLFCGGGGNLQGGSCKSGGVNADGSCSDGTLNWSVFCPGTSAQTWTFYMESVPSYYGTIVSNVTLRPIPTDMNSVEGYVGSCTSGHVCIANGNNILINALSSHPACPSGSTYNKFTPNGNSSQPVCASGLSLRCTDSALTGCVGGFVLDASP